MPSPQDQPDDPAPEVSRTAGGHSRADPLFVRSLNPMLIVDDQRRYVDANAAACLFMRLSHDALCALRVEDLTPPKLRPRIDAMWAECSRGSCSRPSTHAQWDMHMPDGACVAVDLSYTPHFRRGLHLAILVFPAATELDDQLGQARLPDSRVLTPREREILTLVALGNTGVEIAAQLFLSPATVQTHVVNTLIKLNARNRAHAIAIGVQTGELDLDMHTDKSG